MHAADAVCALQSCNKIFHCSCNINYHLCLDIAELNLPKTCQLDFPDPDDLLNFKLIICPDEVRRLCSLTCVKCIVLFHDVKLTV